MMKHPDTARVNDAALALRDAVVDYLRTTKTGKGRRTVESWTGVVGESLGFKRVHKRRFQEVVDHALAEGLLEIEESAVGRRTFVVVGIEVETETFPLPPSPVVEDDEDDDSPPPPLDPTKRCGPTRMECGHWSWSQYDGKGNKVPCRRCFPPPPRYGT
jgi:hypothetical protein